MSSIANRLLSCALGVLLIQSVASGELVDFEGLVHGQVVTNQYAALGLTISAVNDGGGPDAAVAFNSSLTGTADPDLEGPVPGAWNGGNLPANTFLGNLLIVQANATGIGDEVANNPQSGGGSIFLDFSTPITSFALDAVDIDGPDAGNSSITFFRNGVELGSFTGVDLKALDNSLTPGNNSANRVQAITAAQLGVPDFNQVVLEMNRCTVAIDNLQFTLVPEAGSLSLMAIGACTLVGYGCRRARVRKTA